jgi:ketosteroid isomerase-like protein
MRAFVVGAVAAAAAVLLAGCGGSGSSAVDKVTQRDAELYQIDQIERTWHKAASTHDLDLMMTIWAPNATFSLGGKTVRGKAAIRAALAKAGPFQPQNHWISDTPAYKIRTTVNGDKGTLYFECHYVDAKTGKVVAVVGADQDVEKINGKWLISNVTAASPTLGH